MTFAVSGAARAKDVFLLKKGAKRFGAVRHLWVLNAPPRMRAAHWQVAKAARATVDQIDIVDMYAQRDGDAAVLGRDADAVVLIKFAEIVKCLQVTAVAGKDFPVADPTGGEPFVTFRLKPRPAGASRAKARAPSLLPPTSSKPSLMAKLAQHAVYQTRSRAGLRGPHPRFGDRFDFVLYDENQVKTEKLNLWVIYCVGA